MDEDTRLVAGKARFIGVLMRDIRAYQVVNDREAVADCVAMINALLLPRAYVCVSDDGSIHVVKVMLKQEDEPGLNPGTLTALLGRAQLSLEITHSADVIWRFEPVTGLWTVLKDRTGTLQSLCPIKFGGMPTVKLTSGG